MKFGVPMSNPSPDLTDKVKATFLSQVSEIANQVCDGMLVAGAAVPLINRDGLGGPAMWSALSVMLFPSGLLVPLLQHLKIIELSLDEDGSENFANHCTTAIHGRA